MAKEPVPSRSIPAIERPAPARVREAPAGETRLQVFVRYYRRMRLQRVYALMVTVSPVSRDGEGGTAGSVVLRPFIPGALVTPSQVEVRGFSQGRTATFQVTPLGRGKLHNARVEVYQQGQLVQEIPLAMRSVTQRMTWVLAALTVLVWWGLHYLAEHNRNESTRVPTVQGNKPPPAGLVPARVPRPGGLPPEAPPGGGGEKRQPMTRASRPALGMLGVLLFGVQPPGSGAKGATQPDRPSTKGQDKGADAPKDKEKGKPMPQKAEEKKASPSGESPAKGEPPAGQPAPPAGAPGDEHGPARETGGTSKWPAHWRGSPGDQLQRKVESYLPNLQIGSVSLTEYPLNAIGWAYDNLLFVLSVDDRIPSYVGAVFLGLTVISWFLHNKRRARSRGKPFVLAPAR